MDPNDVLLGRAWPDGYAEFDLQWIDDLFKDNPSQLEYAKLMVRASSEIGSNGHGRGALDSARRMHLALQNATLGGKPVLPYPLHLPSEEEASDWEARSREREEAGRRFREEETRPPLEVHLCVDAVCTGTPMGLLHQDLLRKGAWGPYPAHAVALVSTREDMALFSSCFERAMDEDAPPSSEPLPFAVPDLLSFQGGDGPETDPSLLEERESSSEGEEDAMVLVEEAPAAAPVLRKRKGPWENLQAYTIGDLRQQESLYSALLVAPIVYIEDVTALSPGFLDAIRQVPRGTDWILVVGVNLFARHREDIRRDTLEQEGGVSMNCEPLHHAVQMGPFKTRLLDLTESIQTTSRIPTDASMTRSVWRVLGAAEADRSLKDSRVSMTVSVVDTVGPYSVLMHTAYQRLVAKETEEYLADVEGLRDRKKEKKRAEAAAARAAAREAARAAKKAADKLAKEAAKAAAAAKGGSSKSRRQDSSSSEEGEGEDLMDDDDDDGDDDDEEEEESELIPKHASASSSSRKKPKGKKPIKPKNKRGGSAKDRYRSSSSSEGEGEDGKHDEEDLPSEQEGEEMENDPLRAALNEDDNDDDDDVERNTGPDPNSPSQDSDGAAPAPMDTEPPPVPPRDPSPVQGPDQVATSSAFERPFWFTRARNPSLSSSYASAFGGRDSHGGHMRRVGYGLPLVATSFVGGRNLAGVCSWPFLPGSLWEVFRMHVAWKRKSRGARTDLKDLPAATEKSMVLQIKSQAMDASKWSILVTREGPAEQRRAELRGSYLDLPPERGRLAAKDAPFLNDYPVSTMAEIRLQHSSGVSPEKREEITPEQMHELFAPTDCILAGQMGAVVLHALRNPRTIVRVVLFAPDPLPPDDGMDDEDMDGGPRRRKKRQQRKRRDPVMGYWSSLFRWFAVAPDNVRFVHASEESKRRIDSMWEVRFQRNVEEKAACLLRTVKTAMATT